MEKKSNANLTSRLDLIQEKIWNVEEELTKNFEVIKEQQSEIKSMKTNIKLMVDKLNKLEKVIREFRKKNGVC